MIRRDNHWKPIFPTKMDKNKNHKITIIVSDKVVI